MLGKLSIIGAVAAIFMIPTALSAQMGGAINPGVHVGGTVNPGATRATDPASRRPIVTPAFLLASFSTGPSPPIFLSCSPQDFSWSSMRTRRGSLG
jgi:hypothetical protein